MPEMKLSIVDENVWNENWEQYSSISYSDEILASEQKEQGQIEQLISDAISEEFSPDFDWVVDHFSTPSYIFTITLQNSQMFNRELIEKIHGVVVGFSEKWSLNLGLVDAIHDGVWDSVDEVATLFCTHDKGIIIHHSEYKFFEGKCREWLGDMSQP